MTTKRMPSSAGVKAPQSSMRLVPSRTIEKEYMRELYAQRAQENECISEAETCCDGSGLVLAGVDEVGRGSLAGPVCVGIAVVTDRTSDSFPAGLRDSKQLTAGAREALLEPCAAWVHAWAVGGAHPDEINKYGIIVALRIAAARAAQTLAAAGITFDAVLLDGSHNWWSPAGLFDMCADGTPVPQDVPQPPDVPVRTVVKGDAQCAVIAAASVYAKVQRDAQMVALSDKYPQYHWDRNKGYSSETHIAALKQYGASEIHRTAWRLPGIS